MVREGSFDLGTTGSPLVAGLLLGLVLKLFINELDDERPAGPCHEVAFYRHGGTFK